MDGLRITIAVLMVAGGMTLIGTALYLQWASLPQEHTRKQVATRAILGLIGLALVVGGAQQLP
jgi:uncharacterized membrane protein YidH (DUF202 family)